MTRNKVRRFSPSEIIVHWSCALLYLTLFATGIALAAARLLDCSVEAIEKLATIHRITGIAFVIVLAHILLLSILSRNFRCLWRTLIDCMRWRWADVLWLLKSPLNAITARVTLPPAGRFNAGQKLHVLAIAMLLPAFAASGLAIILIPGALGPWIIHTLYCVPAAAFLSLHMFMSLLNPETRKALPSIFTGSVSDDYARRHHSLWIGSDHPKHTLRHVSPAWLTATIIVILTSIALATLSYGPARTHELVKATINQRAMNTISPGQLTTAHAVDKTEPTTCNQCHNLFTKPARDKCLQCHQPIADRIAAKAGFHGTLSAHCSNCHREHHGPDATLIDFDAQTFNHDLAQFKLLGAHQTTPCQKCHPEKPAANRADAIQYIALPSDNCTTCHINPHPVRRTNDCLRCHTMAGWDRKQPNFDHNRNTTFPLNGAHAAVDCVRCHRRETVDGRDRIALLDVGESCLDCHADPHQDQFRQTCNHCHTEQGWTRQWLISFHTPDSPYPLKGRHAPLKCEQCHKKPESNISAETQFANLPKDCITCHNDPHDKQMTSPCTQCHTELGWTEPNVTFSHDRQSTFTLDRLHSKLTCDDCHGVEEKRYRPLPHNCDGCHQTQAGAIQGQSSILQGPPDPHNSRLSCDDCHNLTAASEDIDNFAKRCVQCHNSHYGQLMYEWTAAFEQSSTDSQKKLPELKDTDNERSKRIRSAIEEAQSIGAHNPQLTRRIWKHILEEM